MGSLREFRAAVPCLHPVGHDPQLLARIAALLGEAEMALQDDTHNAYACLEQAMELLRQANAYHDYGARPAGSGLTPWQTRRLDHYISQHLAAAIRTCDLAAQLNLSSSHFSHVFKQTFGITQPYTAAFVDAKGGFSATAMWNFFALILCLMVGTASLPHILMRYFTTPSVKQARDSVAWSLFFIFLLYFTAPAYAAFAKLEVYQNLIGTPIAWWLARTRSRLKAAVGALGRSCKSCHDDFRGAKRE